MELTNFNNIGIVHHDKDSDGFLSGALMKFYLELKISNYELIPYNYEPDFDVHCRNLKIVLNNFDCLIFVDCSPPTEWFEYYLNHNNYYKQKIIFIDHHKNKMLELNNKMIEIIGNNKSSDFEITESKVINKNKDILNINFCNNNSYKQVNEKEHFVEFFVCLSDEEPLSAAKLVFEKYYKPIDINFDTIKFINLVSSYDTWTWFDNEEQKIVNSDALYLEAYLRKNWDFNEYDNKQKIDYFYSIISQIISKHDLDYLIEEGKKIHEAEVAKIDYNNFQFIVNLPSTSTDDYENLMAMISFGTASSFINQYYPREHFKKLLNIDIDLMIYPKFDYEKKIVKISMRTINMDLSYFIKYMKNIYNARGGGHKHAGRCELSFKEFNNFISNFKFGLHHNWIYKEIN